MTIEESAFHVIKKKKDGIYQNELWKELEIDSRKCSRIISKLLEEGLVTRESAVSNGSRTYLIKANTQTQPSYEMLLGAHEFSPCAGCRDACQPETCPKLTEWITIIIKNEILSEAQNP